MVPAVTLASFVASVSSVQQLPPPTLAEAAFAGRSNVGKSSLLNRLLSRHKLVRTGSSPGTTRALNIFMAQTADDLRFHLVDLPGYGYARTGKAERASWGPLVEGYLSTRVSLRGVVLLVDVRRGVEDDDLMLIDFVKRITDRPARHPLELVLVATKIDKLPRSARAPALARACERTGKRALPFSATTGEGSDELWRALRATICQPP